MADELARLADSGILDDMEEAISRWEKAPPGRQSEDAADLLMISLLAHIGLGGPTAARIIVDHLRALDLASQEKADADH